MAKKLELPQLPSNIQVDIMKGESGILLAKLPAYDVFTEADSLNELFGQVNDLIYAYFEVPKKFQDRIRYIPPREVQENLIRIAEQDSTKRYSEFNVRSYYDISLLKGLTQIQA